MTEPTKTEERISDYLLADAEQRLQYQHEYTVAGFKTLLLMNGGAIIGLLTYAGNASDKVAASQFMIAFLAYVAGLVLTALAYLTSYMGQAHIMQFSATEGMRWRGLEPSADATKVDHEKLGERAIEWGKVLAVLALTGFIVGSGFAVSAITDQPARPAIAAPGKPPPSC
jgi:hypothetical protein